MGVSDWPGTVTYSCNNIQCRVLKYQGGRNVPLAACPVCLYSGTEEKLEPVPPAQG